MDYTCAWERTFGISLRGLPTWVQRRVAVAGPRAGGRLDVAAVVALSRRVHRSRKATSLAETTRVARPRMAA